MAVGLKIAPRGADIQGEACCDGKFNIVSDVRGDIDIHCVIEYIDSNIVVNLCAIPGQRHSLWHGYKLDR
jgi:hypothetical protein